MFIVQQKKRRNQSNGQGQQTRKRKKEKERRRSNRRCQCGGNLLHWVCSNHAFLLFFLSAFVSVEFLFSGRNVRYCPIRPVLSGIGWNLEWYILKVFRYRFIDRYEKFQPLATYTYVWFFLPWTFKSRINTTYTYVWFFLLWTFKSKINTTYTCRYNRISAGRRKERVE